MKGPKSLLLVIAVLATVALVAGYTMVNRGLGTDTKLKTGTILDKFNGSGPTVSSSPVIDETIPFLITDRKAVSISNSFNRNSLLYFEKNTGKLFEYNLKDRKESVVSDTILPDFISARWLPDKKSVISLFSHQTGSEFKYHNYDTGKTVSLGSDIFSLAISPDGEFIAYYSKKDPGSTAAEDSSKIFISQPDGLYPKKIINTRIDDLNMFWPQKDKLAFLTPSSELFLVNRDGELTKIFDKMTGLSIKWSISGKKLIFSYIQDFTNPQTSLWVKNIETKAEISLDLIANASACTWSIDDVNVFCAIPKSPSADDIYKINTDNGSKKLVAEPGLPVREMLLSSLEDYLLFTTISDEKLDGFKIGN